MFVKMDNNSRLNNTRHYNCMMFSGKLRVVVDCLFQRDEKIKEPPLLALLPLVIYAKYQIIEEQKLHTLRMDVGGMEIEDRRKVLE